MLALLLMAYELLDLGVSFISPESSLRAHREQHAATRDALGHAYDAEVPQVWMY